MNHKLNIYFFLLLLSTFLIIPSISLAASGCCKITTTDAVLDNSQTVYITMSGEDCDKRKGINTQVVFEEGKQAAKNNKSCEEIAGTTGDPKPSKPVAPKLQVSIPGFGKFSDVSCDDPKTPCQFPWIGEYIKAIYDYSLAIIGILSVIVMMIGGVIRLTAGGNNAQISNGNAFIKSSVLGVIFTLCSYLILFIVNPNLTIFRPINVSYLEHIDLEAVNILYDKSPEVLVDNLKYPTVLTSDQQSKSKTKNQSCESNPCEDCVVTALPTKNNNNINRSLNNKLLTVRSSVSWRITEAYPCTQKHASKCHYNGKCVDIGITSEKSCANFLALINDLKTAGLNVFNESGCGGDSHQTTYSSGAHLHVSE